MGKAAFPFGERICSGKAILNIQYLVCRFFTEEKISSIYNSCKIRVKERVWNLLIKRFSLLTVVKKRILIESHMVLFRHSLTYAAGQPIKGRHELFEQYLLFNRNCKEVITAYIKRAALLGAALSRIYPVVRRLRLEPRAACMESFIARMLSYDEMVQMQTEMDVLFSAD